MVLRKGKTKYLVEKSIDSALLAVETYNSPRKDFRLESYVVLMIIASTKLFHAYFNSTQGDKYYYKNKNGRYKIIDGERKTWELKTCIVKYGKLDEAVKKNFTFFIKLRNKIEHSCIDQKEIGRFLFGECQSLLFNYETLLTEFFGEEYAINESLAFSLQFSFLRSSRQLKASKKLLSKEMVNIKKFVSNYRSSLSEEIFNSPEFSIKLIQIPKVSNTNRNDLAVEFVNWNQINQEDKTNYQKLLAIIKPKIVKHDVSNLNKFSSGQVVKEVKIKIGNEFNNYDHSCLYYIFSIHPYGFEKQEKEKDDTNTDYCLYDEPHDDYVFYQLWIDFIIQLIETKKMTKKDWRLFFKNKEKKNIKDYN